MTTADRYGLTEPHAYGYSNSARSRLLESIHELLLQSPSAATRSAPQTLGGAGWRVGRCRSYTDHGHELAQFVPLRHQTGCLPSAPAGYRGPLDAEKQPHYTEFFTRTLRNMDNVTCGASRAGIDSKWRQASWKLLRTDFRSRR